MNKLKKISNLELLQELKRRIESEEIILEHFVPEDDFYAVHGLRIRKQFLDLNMLLFKYRQKEQDKKKGSTERYAYGKDLDKERKEDENWKNRPRDEGERWKLSSLSYRMNVSIERSEPIKEEEKGEEI